MNFADKTLSIPTPFRLEREQWIAEPIETVFAFFGDPANLQEITPPWMKFHITSCSTPEIEVGTVLEYALRVRGFPMKWVSRISVWEPPFRFVDEQLHGPYRRWHHEHTFEEVDGRTCVRDRIDYAVPGGKLVERLIVRADLERIFRYRYQALAAHFLEYGTARASDEH